MLQELLDQRILTRQGERWIFHSQDLPLEFSFPDGVSALLGERLHRLSVEAEGLAGALASEGRGCSPAKLPRAAWCAG